MKKFTTGLAALALAAGVGIGTAATASANAQYGCSTMAGHLHATATLINYGSSKGTGVYVSATGTYKEVITFGPDITWRFNRVSLTSLGTKYTNPAVWGSSAHPLNFNTKYAKVTWHGTQLGVQTDTTHSCTIKVGR